MAMDQLGRDGLHRLVDFADSHCITMYLPTHKRGLETKENPVRMKNLGRQAERQLRERGLPQEAAAEFMRPVYRLVEDTGFWNEQDDGLAVFLASDYFEHYRLPWSFQEQVYVSQHFYVRPLVPLLSGNGRFYLLSLSQNAVRLYEGDKYGMDEIEIKGAPRRIEDISQYAEMDETLRWHSFAPSTGKGGPAANLGENAMYHSHGKGVEGRQIKNELVREFIKLVGNGIEKQIAGTELPLVVAGNDYTVGTYRKFSSYPHLKKDILLGNTELTEKAELHRRAWAVVQSDYEYDFNRRMSHFRTLSNTDQITTDPKRLINAAYQGRLDTLFIDPSKQLWGTFHPTDGEIQVQERHEAGNEDLLDMTVHYALDHGSYVYPVEQNEMPEHAMAAGILRY